jgi:chitin deacetylase
VFALTFDDGPGPDTEALLDVLRDAGAHATFFVLGRNVEEAPWCGDPVRARALAVRMAREGHVVGNHTWSHFRPDRWKELAPDVRRGEQVVRAVRREAGVPETPVPFRLPYGIQIVEGALDPRVPVVASLGLGHQHWTSDFAARMAAHIEAFAALGLDAVLDLHDSGTGSSFGYARSATAEGVRLLLEEARRRGWKSYTVP